MRETMTSAMDETSPAAARPEAGNAAPEKHFTTLGEHRFNLRVYRSIGWFTNAALSVGAVLFAERTHTGRRVMQKFGDGFIAATKWTGLKPETARYLAEKTFYLTGGFAVMAPMKWLEDRKVAKVKAWNREIYGAEAASDPAIAKSEAELERAPKQGWKSILSARVLALVPFYITVGALWGRESQLSKLTQETVFIERPIVGFSRWLGKWAAKLGGNTEAEAQIVRVRQASPGTLQEPAMGARAGDPIHSALPTYILSESITSGMVAAGVYLITRITGPLFGQTKAQRAQEVRAAEPAAAMFRSKQLSVASASEPQRMVSTEGLAHEAPSRERVPQRA